LTVPLVFTIFLITLTSILAYAATRGTRTVRAVSVREAIRALFESIGAFALFLAMNAVLGVTIIVMSRSLTQRFITVYDLDSPLLLLLSAAQGLVFRQWWNRD
jgi:hypothetical protein